MSLTLVNHTAELERLRAAVDAFADSNSLPSDVTYVVHLALDEVVANVIRHAHDDKQEHPIGVDVALGDGILRVEVVDEGKPFNPLAAPPPIFDVPLEERRPGGLGIHIVKTVMDELEYRRANGRNKLTMLKNLASFDADTLA